MAVRAEPEELSRDLIAATLARRWSIVADVVEYLPVGGGGHHWRAVVGDTSQWFVTANGLVGRGHWLEPDADSVYARTETAYETVRELRLAFAVTAIPDRTGSLLYRVRPDWALSVYPHIDTVEVEAGQPARAVAGFVGQLHTLPAPASIPRWRSDLPQRPHVERAIVEHDQSWGDGPYAEPTRTLVAARCSDLTKRLDRYDQLVAATEAEQEPWVLTHGEPHGGNTLQTTTGATLLIDWDTLAVAPRERDLWQLVDGAAGPVWDAYRTASGYPHGPRPAYLELFPLWWRLAEIGSYIRRFRGRHVGDADDDAAWRNLGSLLG